MKSLKFIYPKILILILSLSFISSSLNSNNSNNSHSYDLQNPESRNLLQNEIKKLEEEKNNLRFLEKENPSNPLDSEVPNYCDLRPNAKYSNYYYWLPVLKAKVNSTEKIEIFESSCFKENKMFISKLSKEETIINLISSNPRNLICKDSYIFSLSNFHAIHPIFIHGEKKIYLKNLSDSDLMDLKVNGLRLFAFCQGFLSSFNSILMTLKLFLGGMGSDPNAFLPINRPKVPKYMEEANKQFLKEFVNLDLKERDPKFARSVLNIKKEEIKSGDFLFVFRLNGLGPLIMLGTGGHISHSAVAIWENGELYVVESRSGGEWPRVGVQKNKWSDWIQWANNADFHVAILPLRNEYREKFNSEKAMKWFNEKMDRKNYGFHNFIFSWIDTKDKNLPDLLQLETLFFLFSIIEKISKAESDLIMGEALNFRVGTKGKKLHEVAYKAAEKNQTIEELFALPEIEGWEYSDGLNYVCSAFAVAIWKKGDMFGELEINSTEFTPKDVIQMDIFDLEYKEKRPEICKEADPELPFCQIMGKYKIDAPGYSSIKPYSRMNERCPSMFPDYYRPDGC